MMTTNSQSLALVLFVSGVLLTPLSLSAQNPFESDPFGGGAAAPVEPAAAGGGPSSDSTTTVEVDPIVKNIMDAKPTAPADLVRSIEILLNFDHADAAKTLLDQLNATTLTPEQLVELHTRFRSAVFFRIGREQRLRPAGSEFEKRVMEAARQAARDSKRIATLIGQLSDSDPARRHVALVDLREAQDAAINAILQVLGDASRSAEHAAVRNGLVTILTPPADVQIRNETMPLTELLVSATATSDPALKMQILSVLGRLSASEAVPFMVRPALAADGTSQLKRVAQHALLNVVGALPTVHEAEIYLERRVQTYLGNQQTTQTDNQSTTKKWQWDDASGIATSKQFDIEHAALLDARRVSRELHLLNPDKQQYRNLYLATALQTEKTLGGRSQPLSQAAGTAFAETAAGGVAAATEVLDFALSHNLIAGAMGAVEVLGEIGDAEMLTATDGRPGLLARMLLHENRRMRFTAAQAILKLDPQGPYPGSSYLAETLAYFASTGGTRRVLVAHPRTADGQFVVGLLRELGFEADTAQTGNQTIKFAHASPDYQFVLISDAIDRTPISELLQQLRRDPRTRRLPLGVMTRQASAQRIAYLTKSDPRTISFPRLHSTEGTRIQVRRLLQISGRGRLDDDERLSHARFALEHIVRLASQPEVYAFYDLVQYEPTVRGALANSFLADEAATALGLLATPGAQKTLLEVVNQSARPIMNRQAAAKAFETSVQLRGILLTGGEILAQYKRYNESATADVETQELLGSILDAIEAPTKSELDAVTGVATDE